MRFIYVVNSIIILGWASLVYFTQPSHEQVSPNWWIDVLVLGGMIIFQLQMVVKSKTLYGFSIVMSYTLALLIGMRLMLSVDWLLTLKGIGFLLVSALCIFYLIGVRGFLRSDKGRAIMGQSTQ